jgi:hypothetical protein
VTILPAVSWWCLSAWLTSKTNWPMEASSFHGFRGSSRDIIVDVLCSLLASDSAHLLLRDRDTNGIRTWLRLLFPWRGCHGSRDSFAPVLLLVFACRGQPHRRLDHSPHRHRRGQEDRDDGRKDPIYSYLWITCARSKTWTFGWMPWEGGMSKWKTRPRSIEQSSRNLENKNY